MKFKIIGIFFIIILLFSIGCSGSTTTGETTTAANTTEIPQTPSIEELAAQGFYLPELPRITCEQLKQMLDSEEPLVVVDTRIEFMFNLGHLPQTINIPAQSKEEQLARFVTLPKDRPIIFYCD
jgi:hypothetical protein